MDGSGKNVVVSLLLEKSPSAAKADAEKAMFSARLKSRPFGYSHPLQKRKGWGTHSLGNVNEIESPGHPSRCIAN
jgi:hypothetical protein